ncbi:unnamed protein product [Knipowitschia caucasica]
MNATYRGYQLIYHPGPSQANTQQWSMLLHSPVCSTRIHASKINQVQALRLSLSPTLSPTLTLL